MALLGPPLAFSASKIAIPADWWPSNPPPVGSYVRDVVFYIPNHEEARSALLSNAPSPLKRTAPPNVFDCDCCRVYVTKHSGVFLVPLYPPSRQ